VDNQASGRAYGSAGAGGSLIIGQLGIWSAGGHLIIIVSDRLRCPRSLARPGYIPVNGHASQTLSTNHGLRSVTLSM